MKGAAIVQDDHIHFVDHLLPLSAALNIPLLFTSRKECTLTQSLYPYSNLHVINYEEIAPNKLAQKYDVIVSSDYWSKKKFHKMFKDKNVRNIFCPHGFSDKGFWFKMCVDSDILLVYGQNMLDLLETEGVLNHIGPHVITGNYRNTYYQNNRSFFDPIAKKTLFQQLNNKNLTILYAPTCVDLQYSSTFFELFETLINTLPEQYNLVVKPHPLLEHNDLVKYHSIIGKYSKKKNILVLENFPPIYPLLAHVDVYLGDMSSIGYDCLPFNLPLFFLNKLERPSQTDRNLYLYRCGTEILPNQYKDIYTIIERELPKDKEKFTEIRQEVYRYTFGEEKSFDVIKDEINAVCKI